MREQFDKKLVNKIKSTFKELEEEYDASEWDKFSKNYFNQKGVVKSYLTKWVSGIAAAILLGISLYTIIKPVQNIPNEDQNLITNIKEQTPEAIESRVPNNNNPLSQSPERKQQDQLNLALGADQKSIENDNLYNSSSKKADPKASSSKKALTSDGSEKSTLPEILLPDNPIKPVLPNNGLDLMAKTEAEQMTQEEALEQIKEWKGENTLVTKNSEITEGSFVKEPMKFGVLVAPQTISNSTQSLNLGAGLMSEISFSKKIKLDVGLAFARQNISPATGGNILMANVTNDADGLNSRSAAFTGNVINATRELSFGQVDIPINLKYKVYGKKESDIYVISGVSNMFYLNQQDVTTFTTANLATANFASNQQMVSTYMETTTPDSQSNGVDTGRMMNFGVGIERNLKNGTFLSIEPFYKIPLGNQTFTNQQFSMGGINLRMNFQLKTKKE
jgi:hypothetical protein